MSEADKNLTIICLGSNVVERLDIVRHALAQLERWFRVITMSEYYESDDDSGLGEPYVNLVVSGVPLVDLDTLQTNIKALETSFGRDEMSKERGVMPLDIDVVVWHGKVVDPEEYCRPYFRYGLDGVRV